MEVKNRFKKTEVGIIPEDWEVNPLQDLCIKIQDGTHFSPKIAGGEYLYITSKNIKFGFLDFSNADRIDKIQHANIFRRCDVRAGDLLLTKDGANTGNAAINTIEEEFSLLSSVAFLRFDTKKYDPYYFLQQILTHAGQFRIKEAMSGNAITRLTLEKIKKLYYSFPPTKAEQTAIATALLDADSVIISLENLIAKKKAIKHGIMQSVLTGRKRLAGFNKRWGLRKLSELGKPYGGLSGKSKKDFENGKVPYIPFMNIMSNATIDINYFDYVTLAPSESQNKVMKGDLLFNGSSETPEEVGMCSVLLKDVPNLYLNSFCFGFRLNPELNANGLYLTYFFRSSIGRKLFYSSAQGATRYNLSKSNFLKIEIPYPEPEEQEMIAELLSDLDNEILQLDDKIQKYKQVKQGMMQQLLTGKIRLV